MSEHFDYYKEARSLSEALKLEGKKQMGQIVN